jgi:hypothetical protein
MTDATKFRKIDPLDLRAVADRERQDRNRRLVFIGVTILTAVAIVCDLLSDIFLRPLHQTAAGHHVTVATDWDLSASLFILAWVVVTVKLWRRK